METIMNHLTLIIVMLTGLAALMATGFILLELISRRDRRNWNERLQVMGQNIKEDIRRADYRFEQWQKEMHARQAHNDSVLRRIIVRNEREARAQRARAEAESKRMHEDTQTLIRMFMERWGLDGDYGRPSANVKG